MVLNATYTTTACQTNAVAPATTPIIEFVALFRTEPAMPMAVTDNPSQQVTVVGETGERHAASLA